ncbi:hypothetical protein J6590_086753 [Homalodisca vitripennis]|nr:hypothetical protein J6590_086753 [Homalodisca vitripennis]
MPKTESIIITETLIPLQAGVMTGLYIKALNSTSWISTGGGPTPKLTHSEYPVIEEADLIKQNKWESRYSTRSMVLIKSARVTDRIRICAISNSNPTSNVLDH